MEVTALCIRLCEYYGCENILFFFVGSRHVMSDMQLFSFVSPVMDVLVLLVAQVNHSYIVEKVGKLLCALFIPLF